MLQYVLQLFCYSMLFFSAVNGLVCVADTSQSIFQLAISMSIFTMSWLFVLQTKSILPSLPRQLYGYQPYLICESIPTWTDRMGRASKSKWEWPWNAIITDHIQDVPCGTERKRLRRPEPRHVISNNVTFWQV